MNRCTLIGQQYDTLRGEWEEKNGGGGEYKDVCFPHVTFVKVFSVKYTENKLASKTTYFGRIGYKVVYRSLIYQTGLQISVSFNITIVMVTLIVTIAITITILIINNNLV